MKRCSSSSHTPHTGSACGRPLAETVTTQKFLFTARRSAAHDQGRPCQSGVSTPYWDMSGRSILGADIRSILRVLRGGFRWFGARRSGQDRSVQIETPRGPGYSEVMARIASARRSGCSSGIQCVPPVISTNR